MDVGNPKPGPSKPLDDIKSTAVVMYSVPKPPNYLKLQSNTDLNLPPSNWLSNSAESYGLQHVHYKHKEFSSFRMAHMFPDCVGEVDVVSDAENIKNLLKIPYSKGHISMMVHRVENTLLLDDFDIYKHLLRTAKNEWEWLRKFFCENVESGIVDEERLLFLKEKKLKSLKQKHLVSKFLYYSLGQNESDMLEEGHGRLNNSSLQVEGPLLPEPSPDEEVPDPTSFDHKYNRNVVWTFEDIEMLIGTDLPIFGGGTHPCISLRLRDMNKPINVLTGIDYWLDNLMSNVPEVVMCYHLNGIVQKYELVKTEDLPSMQDSKFSPKLIRDVAQSILSFLKSNATKAGHTYWLFKGKDEEVVKLYDLTSLCSDDEEDNDQNPFTVPVAMLLYRVARNMKHTQVDSRQPGTIRILLKNCLKLLSEEKYPEIVTSSHYMLADLYIPANTNPDNPQLENETNKDNAEEVYDDDDLECDEDPLKFLVLNSDKDKKFNNNYKQPPPISGTVEERCLQALNHVASGLNCLQYFRNEEKIKEEDNIPMAKSTEPIPMPYNEKQPEATKKKGKKKDKLKKKSAEADNQPSALLPKSTTEALPAWQELSKTNITWKEHLKTLLYEKCVLIYAILSEHHYINKNYGHSLRYLGLLVRCLLIMKKLKYSICTLEENCLLGRAGDCCVMMVQRWEGCENYRNQFHTHMDEDLKMLQQLEKDEQLYVIQLAESNMKCVLIYDIRTIEQMLLKAIECYDEALKKIKHPESILRRLGNSLNETGAFYLNKAKMFQDGATMIEYCKKSEPHLKRATEIFETVKDEANAALVFTNTGHLHRLLAYAHSPSGRGELTSMERYHYNKSFVSYKKALSVIAHRSHCPAIWDAVKWEMSTAIFTMATILHENPSKENIVKSEKEVLETLSKALNSCDLDESNPKFPLYQYRAATIYYRYAGIYHKNMFNEENDGHRKTLAHLSKLNYQKASELYLQSMDPINYLTSQMQLFALNEYIADNTSVPGPKLNVLKSCIKIIVQLSEVCFMIVNRKVDVSEKDVSNFRPQKKLEVFEGCDELVVLAKLRLQHTLKAMTKLCLTKPPFSKDAARLAELYKGCYKLTFQLEQEMDFYAFVKKLGDILVEIKAKVADE
ncbi:PREDICTED: erythroid differentiation-related factor 1 [Nicrophorus vespilloides]|uniref:Erythroid differentiation-related factor 1 n=1 Tax=Nicrophorus vespilloides TaxID=110193 RepID=A0ABM1M4L1_NICVS|nr:PREDICTED: erythroid differentiation-related factor 1 [Nicrophorus vespilloides]XP_017769510.1 PREDICTED: erythroid differentiation-related factor 1 [Nicrophorus vespilloides]XP_017769511.1 PREDICTED: erythroid differentiation-related factor 1 [Nicrophorus vespilloides]